MSSYVYSCPSKNMANVIGKRNPAFANPAVACCCKAWKRAYRAAIRNKEAAPNAARNAGEAYRAAMPPLTTRESCNDFLACVTHGLLIGAICEKDSGKLLYAAQVARTASNSSENPKKSSPIAQVLADSVAKRNGK